MLDTVPCAKGFWSRKFGLEIDKHISSMPSSVTKKKKKKKATGPTVEIFACYFAR